MNLLADKYPVLPATKDNLVPTKVRNLSEATNFFCGLTITEK